ncbi:MAG: ATP-dependent protease subunit HslV [Candidatus Stahlbacteria bacterium]|nr:MAG: ATP-dependent protease subunit HslV [Candidatus Stahlbacteria bacterium]
MKSKIRSTTVLGMLDSKKKVAVIGADGQVTLGETVMKHTARKIRRIGDHILIGFAGSTADALTLYEKFETKVNEHPSNITRAVIELAKEWRMDRALRRLEAFMAILDPEHAFLVSGSGDIIEPDDAIVAIGSGAPYALAAARALDRHSKLSVREIVETSIRITADICLYTNAEVHIEETS